MEQLDRFIDAVITAMLPYVAPVVALLAGGAMAWIRRWLLVRGVEAHAVDAERAIGPGHGDAKKRAAIGAMQTTLVAKTITAPRLSELMETHGVPAAQKYRSSVPPERPS